MSLPNTDLDTEANHLHPDSTKKEQDARCIQATERGPSPANGRS
jgi:hypothetical protein